MIYQGQNMDVDLAGFPIPVASLVLMDIIGVLILIPIMDKLVYPLLGKLKIHVSQLQRIGVGMLFATASMICAGVIEWYRVKKCCIQQYRQGEMLNNTYVADMKIVYQIPQYTLIALSETLTSVTGKNTYLIILLVSIEDEC